MSEWEVGDMALCVRGQGSGYWRDRETGVMRRRGPRRDQFLTVISIVTDPLALAFKEFDGEDHYIASNFLKVTPPREMIEEERKAGVPA